MDPSWAQPLIPLFGNTYRMAEMNDIIKASGADLCPRPANIFRVLHQPIQQVKVIVVGQDPYPDGTSAMGLAFGTPLNHKTPFSLKVIIQSLADAQGVDYASMAADFDETMSVWESDGFFMLNRALTCLKNKPGSHMRFWSGFTAKLVEIIQLYAEHNLIFVLMGGKAKELKPLINEQHFIIECMHPAATRYGRTFDMDWGELADIYASIHGHPLNYTIPF